MTPRDGDHLSLRAGRPAALDSPAGAARGASSQAGGRAEAFRALPGALRISHTARDKRYAPTLPSSALHPVKSHCQLEDAAHHPKKKSREKPPGQDKQPSKNTPRSGEPRRSAGTLGHARKIPARQLPCTLRSQKQGVQVPPAHPHRPPCPGTPCALLGSPDGQREGCPCPYPQLHQMTAEKVQFN